MQALKAPFLPALLGLAGISLPAMALDILPSVELTEIYTDNVDLQPDGQKEHEWVTRVAPSLRLEHAGPGLVVDVDYTLESLFYAEDSDRNEVYNQLASSAVLDVLGRSLQLVAAAEIEQINLSPERAVASSNVNATGNRGDQRMFSIGPQWRRSVFGSSVLDGHVTAARIDFSADEAMAQDVDAVYGRVALHSDLDLWRPVISYELAYEYHRFDYEISDEVIVQSSYLELAYNLSDSFALLGLAGLDSDIEDLRSRSMKEGRWEAGFRAATGNSRVRAMMGHRYFGTSYAFEWENTQPDAGYRLSYEETPVTTELSSLERIGIPAVPGEMPAPLPPDGALSRPGAAVRYVLKRGDASIDRRLFRTAVRLALFVEDREDQVMQGAGGTLGTALHNERAYGGSLRLQWEAGARATIAFDGNWIHRRVNDLSDCTQGGGASCDLQRYSDKLTNLRLDLNYLLGTRTTLTAGLGWLDRNGSLLVDYDEFYARVQLAHAFRL